MAQWSYKEALVGRTRFHAPSIDEAGMLVHTIVRGVWVTVAIKDTWQKGRRLLFVVVVI